MNSPHRKRCASCSHRHSSARPTSSCSTSRQTTSTLPRSTGSRTSSRTSRTRSSSSRMTATSSIRSAPTSATWTLARSRSTPATMTSGISPVSLRSKWQRMQTRRRKRRSRSFRPSSSALPPMPRNLARRPRARSCLSASHWTTSSPRHAAIRTSPLPPTARRAISCSPSRDCPRRWTGVSC